MREGRQGVDWRKLEEEGRDAMFVLCTAASSDLFWQRSEMEQLS